jgi:transposase
MDASIAHGVGVGQVVHAALELQQRRVGTAALRELARQPQVATMKATRRFSDMNERRWNGIAVCCRPQNKVALGFVEGMNNKIRVIQRRA